MNLHSCNGLDALRLLLKHSNGEFDFEPLILATEQLMFSTDTVSQWIMQQLVQNFDELHVTTAALFHVCHEKNFRDFCGNLSVFMT